MDLHQDYGLLVRRLIFFDVRDDWEHFALVEGVKVLVTGVSDVVQFIDNTCSPYFSSAEDFFSCYKIPKLSIPELMKTWLVNKDRAFLAVGVFYAKDVRTT